MRTQLHFWRTIQFPVNTREIVVFDYKVLQWTAITDKKLMAT